ncbi:hypothetical protein [Kitasatospora sp. NPDC059327]|uniref:hypothetical protein n=1 Tax=Kitasatospora sp. NPDC059327 TaxID=3346803 RepID=UPI003675AF71
MTVLVLGVLVLAVGGCVCVVWADRGGPRWVRAVASATLSVGDVLRYLHKNRRRGGSNRSGGGDGD